MFQQIVLVGHLGRDPELRYTPDGKSVANFSLAVNTKKDGPPTWVRVTCWEKLAETVTDHLVKGRQVLVSGDGLQTSAWIDKESGEARASLELTARRVVFLGGGQQSEDGHVADAAQRDPRQTGAAKVGIDDSIPF